MGAERVVGHVHLLAQIGPPAPLHEGAVAGGLQGEDPSRQPAVFGLLACAGPACLGQSGEVGLVGDVQLVVVGVLQFVLRELQGQQAQFRCDGAQFLLVGLAQVGPAAYKTFVGQFQQAPLLVVESAEVVGQAFVVHGFYAAEELLVQGYVVAVLGQQG